MRERLSRHQHCILKRIAFRAGPYLCFTVSATPKWHQAARKHIDLRWKTTRQPVLAGEISYSRSPIAQTGTPLIMLSP